MGAAGGHALLTESLDAASGRGRWLLRRAIPQEEWTPPPRERRRRLPLLAAAQADRGSIVYQPLNSDATFQMLRDQHIELTTSTRRNRGRTPYFVVAAPDSRGPARRHCTRIRPPDATQAAATQCAVQDQPRRVINSSEQLPKRSSTHGDVRRAGPLSC